MCPAPFHGGGGQADQSRGLIDRHTPKKQQIHDARGFFVNGPQLFQCFRHRKKLIRRHRQRQIVVQFLMVRPIASFVGGLSPRNFDQNAPHRFGGRAQEVLPTVPPLPALSTSHAQISLVNKRRRLQRHRTGLPRHLLRGQQPQFLIQLPKKIIRGY